MAEVLKGGPLLDCVEGAIVKVESLGGDAAFKVRLAAMGVTPGRELRVLRRDRVGPLLVLAASTRVALGRDEASRVFISS